MPTDYDENWVTVYRFPDGTELQRPMNKTALIIPSLVWFIGVLKGTDKLWDSIEDGHRVLLALHEPGSKLRSDAVSVDLDTSRIDLFGTLQPGSPKVQHYIVPALRDLWIVPEDFLERNLVDLWEPAHCFYEVDPRNHPLILELDREKAVRGYQELDDSTSPDTWMDEWLWRLRQAEIRLDTSLTGLALIGFDLWDRFGNMLSLDLYENGEWSYVPVNGNPIRKKTLAEVLQKIPMAPRATIEAAVDNATGGTPVIDLELYELMGEQSPLMAPHSVFVDFVMGGGLP